MRLQSRDSQRVHARGAEQRVPAQPVDLGDRVLEQAVNEDDIGTHQLAAPSDLVLDE